MALVCVTDSDYTRKIINSDHIVKIERNDVGSYTIELSSRYPLDVERNDLRKIIQAFGYNDKEVDCYLNFIEY